MDNKRKKELLEEYENRRPEMGVISFKCKATGDVFLGISNDTRADYNSVTAKLSMNSHPNKNLQALWDKYGRDDFEWGLIKELKYDDPKANHTEALEKLREKCLEDDPKARRIWK